MQFNFLKEKAESGESYVVLGRCAEDILQDNDGLISIFLVGDTDVKQKRIMEVKHVSADEALSKMKRHDKTGSSITILSPLANGAIPGTMMSASIPAALV